MGSDKVLYHSIEGIPEPHLLDELICFYQERFEDADREMFLTRVRNNPDLFLTTAQSTSGVVGFKLGYSMNQHTFYSWLGAVHPDYRKQGIANRLAEMQENWAIKKGFKRLRTKTMNRFKPMMILNLKRGFDIIEVITDKKGLRKIVFQKSLS